MCLISVVRCVWCVLFLLFVIIFRFVEIVCVMVGGVVVVKM